MDGNGQNKGNMNFGIDEQKAKQNMYAKKSEIIEEYINNNNVDLGWRKKSIWYFIEYVCFVVFRRDAALTTTDSRKGKRKINK